MTTALNPVVFEAPLVNPAPNGLLAATNWTDEAGPLRWLASGVDVRVFNYGGEAAFGEWMADWCAQTDDLDAGDIKTGQRPDFPDTFLPITTWAFDECDLTQRSQDEVQTRAQQTLRLQEPNAVEAAFAERLLTDAGTPEAVASLKAAVGYLEGELAKTNTVGFIHAGAQWASQQFGLVIKSGTRLVSPLGHTWVFGGGYVDGLDQTLVATSQPFGWRGEVMVQGAPKLEWNRYRAIAERSLVIGYEAVVAAAVIS